MITHKLPVVALTMLALSGNAAHAILPIPEKSGWSGHVGLAAAVDSHNDFYDSSLTQFSFGMLYRF